jgi:glucose/arabinose dehydrogenase
MAFPGHWAPDGIAIYRATQFPAKYRGGAFIAFHGSWNRAPLPQAGYKVVFLSLAGDGALVPETFADGFAGSATIQPGTAAHRPTGITVGPDGSLYVADDSGGRIWRIYYRGQ